jgi:hypothetical protein
MAYDFKSWTESFETSSFHDFFSGIIFSECVGDPIL